MGAEQSDQRAMTCADVAPSVDSSQSSSPHHGGPIPESSSYAPYPNDPAPYRDDSAGVGRLREASDRLRSKLRVRLASSSVTSDRTIPGVVVVNSPAVSSRSKPTDDVLNALQALPNFEPILRSHKPLSSTAAAPSTTVDTDRLLKSIDSGAACRVAEEITRHLATNAQTTANAQSRLITQIANVDRQMGVLMASFTDSQCAFAKHAERLQMTAKLKDQLESCTEQLAQNLQLLTEINSHLPPSSRLQPFCSLGSIRTDQEQEATATDSQ